jgi:TM2 domain-containing membrane protein YozV
MEPIPPVNPQPPSWQPQQPPSDVSGKKLAAGLCGIFFGWLGIHKFILGYTNEGIITIVASILTCGGFGIIGFIEGILYLVKSDQEFYQTYILSKKGWF